MNNLHWQVSVDTNAIYDYMLTNERESLTDARRIKIALTRLLTMDGIQLSSTEFNRVAYILSSRAAAGCQWNLDYIRSIQLAKFEAEIAYRKTYIPVSLPFPEHVKLAHQEDHDE